MLIDLSLCSKANSVACQTAKHSAVKMEECLRRLVLVVIPNCSQIQADPTDSASRLLLLSVKKLKQSVRSKLLLNRVFGESEVAIVYVQTIFKERSQIISL